jgi:hypothetical protein
LRKSSAFSSWHLQGRYGFIAACSAGAVQLKRLRAADRLVLVSLAALFASWRNALLLVQPETLLRWHRDLFRWFWARRSKPKSPPTPRLAAKIIALIKRMSLENRTWGAKRIRGESLSSASRLPRAPFSAM